MLQWLRRSFVTGLVITVPLAVSVVALVWLFGLVESLTRGLERASGSDGVGSPEPVRTSE